MRQALTRDPTTNMLTCGGMGMTKRSPCRIKVTARMSPVRVTFFIFFCHKASLSKLKKFVIIG